ncbi:putative hydrolases or acyltransferase [Aspergillus steynii IBT 23096]|uniref:Putative hydrolases or acyltransferase n=1 Tax=Aspergillus steynii IBT 23096 TaxID=1392250 RepID=A0A2I2GNM3_9EURO|nr:putative hydrolases or acyltransferase [Aspergillus steynii IBT 23096]PLB54459.1 putative hydrolases or acyltransferase [Aspergillus steynii IBT 23096]
MAKAFEIAVPDAQLHRLQQKLETASFPDELDDAEWSRGVPLAEMKRLATYWRDGFNWRQKELELNQTLKQFMVPITVPGFGELDIHCLHHTSPNPNAIPLLFIHGWPGSFLEATKLIPLLTAGNGQPAFHLVVPSLPNFGFSSAVKQKGFGLVQYAEAMHAVMAALGYYDYAIQGGDWGSIIARIMAHRYPDHAKAVHINCLPVMPPLPWRNPLLFLQSLLTIPFSSRDKAHLAATKQYLMEGSSYFHEQATCPQTLGYALHDSPVALLAWIYEKLHSWTDNYSWTDDEILTWVSIYQFSTAGPAASVRIYYEAARKDSPSASPGLTTADVISTAAPHRVQFAVAQFRRELMPVPLSWRWLIGNVVRANEYDCGGHFAAWEVPELLASDVQAFLGRNGQAHGAVAGKSGY